MDIDLLKFPQKSHRKIIKIPSESIKLAELMGIIAGDGGIGNKWQLTISLNSEKDKDYVTYVKVLIESLFGIIIAQRKRPHQNTTVLSASSTSLVNFLISKGVPKGNKIMSGIDIPMWIRKNKNYLKYFIRGLFDTDGCLYIHNHFVKKKHFSNIGFCFTSYAEKLLNSFANTLKDFHINPHIADNGKRVYLYSEKDVIKYLDVFGSSNPRIYFLYKQWRDSRVV